MYAANVHKILSEEVKLLWGNAVKAISDPYEYMM
jgi:hypothetical protein